MSKGESDVVADLKNHAATNRVAISEFLESTVRSYALHCWHSLLRVRQGRARWRLAISMEGSYVALEGRSRLLQSRFVTDTLFTHK
jgi:hypothetical protein